MSLSDWSGAASPLGERVARILEGISSRGTWRNVAAAAGLIVTAVAAAALYANLKAVEWADVQSSVSGTPPKALVAALLFSGASYAALIGYDLLALRYIGERRVRLRTAALASFVGHSFTFTLGFGILTGGAVRMRIYSSAGIEASRIAAVVGLCAGTFWLGLIFLGALALVVAPHIGGNLDNLAPAINRAAGVVTLSALAAYLAWVGSGSRRIRVAGRSISLPGLRTTLAAIVLGAVDATMAALALYMLLPSGADLGFPAFAAIYVVATALGVASHAPGGVGVFEAAMVVALPQVGVGGLLGALLLFRLIYYVCPFILAVGLITAEEIVARRLALRQAFASLSAWLDPLLPRLCAIAVFGGGMILLVSGDLPIKDSRLDLLSDVLPLPFVEVSHLFGSIVGLVLLVVANGLARRLANAWRVAVALLLAGAVFSIAKGIDYEEATGCVLVLVLLLFGRSSFYRRVELFAERPSATWILAAFTVVAASTWLGLVVFQDVSWQSHFWWEFGYREDAPRFVRATLGIVMTAFGIAVYALVHYRAARLGPDCRRSIHAVEPIVAASRRTEAHLAFLGDKRFLVSEGRDGFVMYGQQGRSLIGMGDPVANDPDAVRDLVWRFREIADRHSLKPVFYQVAIDHLPVYLDADFSLTKLGEEALVDLSRFTIEGGEGRRHRQALSRAARHELVFEVVAAPDIENVVDEMRAVSDAWLAGKQGLGKRQEKGFSVGFWSEEYIRRYDVAIIRHRRRIVAFANIWHGSDNEEVSVDLMRFTPDAPAGAMDLMFIELMLLSKRQGYRWFNLGMAPLSGLPGHRLASVWSKLFLFAYRRGNAFFNFEGLRDFKQKFKPVWRPRYLAHPGGLSLPHVLVDCARLVAASPMRAAAQTDGRRPESGRERTHDQACLDRL
jgi:phosphatidylglycerol lysyltransferase